MMEINHYIEAINLLKTGELEELLSNGKIL